MTIELNKDQQDIYNNVVKLCCDIEADMNTSIEASEPAQIEEQLSNLLPYLSNLSDMISKATAIYDWAKGEVAKEIIADAKLMDTKQNILNTFIQGRLAKYNALYKRVESVEKNLRSNIEGLRSMLSYEKELVRNKIQHQ